MATMAAGTRAGELCPPSGSGGGGNGGGKPQRQRLVFIDGFRAMAITFVVVSHCRYLTAVWPENDPLTFGWMNNVLFGATSLFVFISGLLFHHVSYAKWNFARFIRGKVTTLFLPYAVMTAVTLSILAMTHRLSFAMDPQNQPIGANPLQVYLQALATGMAPLAYWYVPFAAMLFAASPLFVRFIRMPARLRLTIMVAAVTAAMMSNRPVGNIDKIQALCYFTFYYLLGIETSIRLKTIQPILARRSSLVALGLLLMVMCLVEAHVQGFAGRYAPWFAPGPPNVRYFEKIVLIYFCCSLCLVWPAMQAALIRRLANASFGVFFVHVPVISLVEHTGALTRVFTGVFLFDVLLKGGLVLTASYTLVRTAQASIPKRSRYLIGA